MFVSLTLSQSDERSCGARWAEMAGSTPGPHEHACCLRIRDRRAAHRLRRYLLLSGRPLTVSVRFTVSPTDDTPVNIENSLFTVAMHGTHVKNGPQPDVDLSDAEDGVLSLHWTADNASTFSRQFVLSISERGGLEPIGDITWAELGDETWAEFPDYSWGDTFNLGALDPGRTVVRDADGASGHDGRHFEQTCNQGNPG